MVGLSPSDSFVLKLRQVFIQAKNDCDIPLEREKADSESEVISVVLKTPIIRFNPSNTDQEEGVQFSFVDTDGNQFLIVEGYWIVDESPKKRCEMHFPFRESFDLLSRHNLYFEALNQFVTILLDRSD